MDGDGKSAAPPFQLPPAQTSPSSAPRAPEESPYGARPRTTAFPMTPTVVLFPNGVSQSTGSFTTLMGTTVGTAVGGAAAAAVRLWAAPRAVGTFSSGKMTQTWISAVPSGRAPPTTEKAKSLNNLRNRPQPDDGPTANVTFVTGIYDIRGRERPQTHNGTHHAPSRKDGASLAPPGLGDGKTDFTGEESGSAPPLRRRVTLHSKPKTQQPVATTGLGAVGGSVGSGGSGGAGVVGNGEWRRGDGVRDVGQYLQLGAEGVLSWDVNWIVFTEPDLVDEVKRVRQVYGLQDRTLVIGLPLEQSPYYAKLPELQDLYDNMRVPKRYSPTKDTPLYVMFTWHKFACLSEAMRRNPFGSTRFYWMDVGLMAVARPTQPNQKALWDAMEREASGRGRLWTSVQIPHELLKQLAANADDYYSEHRPTVQGGFWGGLERHVRWLAKRVDDEIQVSLATRWPALEEALMGRVWAADPQRFLAIQRLFVCHLEALQPPLPAQIPG